MLADASLQFQFKAVPPPPKPPPPPAWWRSFGDFIHAVSPIMGYVLWGVLGLIVLCVVFLLAREIIRTRWPDRFERKAPIRLEAEDWRPTQAQALALMEDADRLAAEGRYAEAVHLLLHRSIQDIQGKRPNLVRPALTSRDISELEALPTRARAAFAEIARIVERSHFGGRPVDAAVFAECRRTYEAFAFPEAWS